jgi:hypothetical protein
LLGITLPRALRTVDSKMLGPAGSYQVLPLSPWADTQQWIDAFGPTDPAAYARGGSEIAATGWLQTPFYDIAWPPGEYLLHAALVRCRAPVPITLTVLCCTSWSVVFLQFYCFARRRLNPVVALLLPFAMLATELMRRFCLSGWGPFISEGLMCPLLVSGFGFLALALEPLVWPACSGSPKRRSMVAGCCAGLCFGLGAYIRAQMELILLVMTMAAVPMLLVGVMAAAWRCGFHPLRSLRIFWSTSARNGLLVTCAVLFVFHACTLPYRVFHNYARYGFLEWTSGYSFMWVLAWRVPASVPPEGAFFVEGGGQAPAVLAPDWNVDAARLDPLEARRLTLQLICQRPLDWLAYKLPILAQYWFSSNRAAGTISFGFAWWENGVILACLTIALGYCCAGLFRGRFAIGLGLLAMIVSVMLATIGPPLIFHFEVRYLHPLKIFALAGLAYIIVLGLRPRSDFSPFVIDRAGQTHPQPGDSLENAVS